MKNAIVVGGGLGVRNTETIGSAIVKKISPLCEKVYVIDPSPSVPSLDNVHHLHFSLPTSQDSFFKCEDVSLLVNCCANYSYAQIKNHEYDYIKVTQGIQDNLAPYLFAITNFLPVMEYEAHIINIASLAGHTAIKDFMPYNLAKSAIIALTKSVALDHPHLYCNSISPNYVVIANSVQGLTYTEIQAIRRKVRKNSPTGNLMYPRDIAEKVLSILFSQVTGQDFILDGGHI
jgi:NAD(P)-dependent dehydrogenase (short-subunit alcohol dehydrogenase family)